MNSKLTFLLILTFPMLCLGSSQEQEALQKQLDAIQRGQKEIRETIDVLQDILLGRRPPAGENSQIDISESPIIGSEKADIVIVEFSDFQCPFCAQYERDTFARLVEQYVDRGMVRYVAINYPLTASHPLAQQAALAGLCAEEQGGFWKYRERLFHDQNALDLLSLRDSAAVLGLDVERFSDCLESGKYTPKVLKDLRQGQDVGVRGTPTFFIGQIDRTNHTQVQVRKMLGGAVPFREFQAVLNNLLTREK
jgi:protein-disulfide isomerase